jgi:hypothetical protein
MTFALWVIRVKSTCANTLSFVSNSNPTPGRDEAKKLYFTPTAEVCAEPSKVSRERAKHSE